MGKFQFVFLSFLSPKIQAQTFNANSLSRKSEVEFPNFRTYLSTMRAEPFDDYFAPSDDPWVVRLSMCC